MKSRGFSLYDMEQFLKDAGAEHINEEAIFCLEKELVDTLKELVSEAQVYANYAGRKRLVTTSDITFAKNNGTNLIVKRSALIKGMAPKRMKRKKSIVLREVQTP